MARLDTSPGPLSVLRSSVHTTSITAISSLGSSDACIVAGDADGQLVLWDLSRRRPSSSARASESQVLSIGLGTANDKVVSQHKDGTLQLWQITATGFSREPLTSMETRSINFCKMSMAVINPPTTQACTGESSISRRTNEAMADQHGDHDDGAGPSCFATSERITEGNGPMPSSHGKLMVAKGSMDSKKVEVYDLENACLAHVCRPKAETGLCTAVQMLAPCDSRTASVVVAGFEDGSICAWDLRNSQEPLVAERLHEEAVLSLAMQSEGELAGMSADANGVTNFFTVDLSRQCCAVQQSFTQGCGVDDIAIRGDGRVAAAAGWNSSIHVYHFRRRRQLGVLKHHVDGVTGLTFTDDYRLMLSCSRDKTIALWSLYPP